MNGFHNIRFPLDVALGATGGPMRRTEIVTLGSGREERNSRWAASRRRFDAGFGVKDLNDLHEVVHFFEERRGRLYGFLWRDGMDYKSCPPLDPQSPLDQIIGIGDGGQTNFPIVKHYGGDIDPYERVITKPVIDSLQVAVDGTGQLSGVDFNWDDQNHQIIFNGNNIPPAGAEITAGFEFDVPVRFDTDELQINLKSFKAGVIPNIPVIELIL